MSDDVRQNPECPNCDKRCGGVCRMVEPVVCPECGMVWERIAGEMFCRHSDGGAVIRHKMRPLPEPHDPDLGALHGVTTWYAAVRGRRAKDVAARGIGYSGFGLFNVTGDDDPTGEHAFLRAVGEE